MEVTINLYYHNNLTRDFIKTLEYSYDEDTSVSDLKIYLINVVKGNTEYIINNVKIGLKSENDKINIPNDSEKVVDVIKNNPVKIFIMNISAPQNAVNIYDTEGITFFFHSNEKRHLPHIHAEYSGNEISVLLTPPFEYKGTMNKGKLKTAINYIKEHCVELEEMFWNLTNAGLK